MQARDPILGVEQETNQQTNYRLDHPVTETAIEPVPLSYQHAFWPYARGRFLF